MMARCGKQYRYLSLTTALFFILTGASFAETQTSSYSSLGKTIISAGIGLFILLALYVLLLTAKFLFKTFKEWKSASHEAAAHDHSEGNKTLSTLSLFFTLFSILTAGTLFLVLFMLASNLDMTSTQAMGALIIKIGVTCFVLLALYIFAMPFLGLLKKGHGEEGHGAPVTGSELPFNPEMTRRSFLSLLGWAWVAFTAATMGALSTMLRFAFPNVTFEPPLKFSAGFPDTYSLGQVDERFKDSHRCWIVRSEQGFYALSTICTHLGCTPNWLSAEEKFKCPCHGSGYYKTGVNFEGPAPRPLERFQITLADDGQIIVDESVKFQSELGQWGMPGSFLDYKA